MKTGEINYNVIRSAEETISELGLTCSSARMVPAGTILMAMYGQGVTRGRVAVLGIEAAINQACLAISPTSHITAQFLYHFLAYRYDAIRDMGHGANQKNLNAAMVKSTPVPMPSDTEQAFIARVLSGADRKIAKELDARSSLEVLHTAMLHALVAGRVRIPVHQASEGGR